MSQLTIESDWTPYTGPDRPEVLATYAHLAIRVDDQTVTRIHHRDSQTTSDRILVSLCPLAEWIAGHWWLLTEESDSPGRTGFSDRHSLKRGRAGYCVPDLKIIPEGDSFQIEWSPFGYEHAPVEFISGWQQDIAQRARGGCAS